MLQQENVGTHTATRCYSYLVVGFGIVRVVVRRFPRPNHRFRRAEEGPQVNSRFQLIRPPVIETQNKTGGEIYMCRH